MFQQGLTVCSFRLSLTTKEHRNFTIATIAFINSGAGGGQGTKVLEKLKKLLSPEQVFDLKADGGPAKGYFIFGLCLQGKIGEMAAVAEFEDHMRRRGWHSGLYLTLKKITKLTQSWILAVKDKMDFKHEPAVRFCAII